MTMTAQITPAETKRQILHWRKQVRGLLAQVTQWSRQNKWKVKETTFVIREPRIRPYKMPGLTIKTPEGDLIFEPIAMHGFGFAAWVELNAIPTMKRVRLTPDAQGWIIMTDSLIPLRQPWTAETFVQLAKDLLA